VLVAQRRLAHAVRRHAGVPTIDLGDGETSDRSAANGFTNVTRLVWSRTVDAAHVGMFISSQASSTSATVSAALRVGGTTVSSAATRCAARLLPYTVRLT
jgi:hypothetical protein